jgi:hypothetical protein
MSDICTMTSISDTVNDIKNSRVLDPIDRNSEILFGLFMALTFTGTLSVATAGQHDVRLVLIAAVGCNIAWGFVDAIMFLLRRLVARGHQQALIRAVRNAVSPELAVTFIKAEMAPMSQAMNADALESVRQWLLALPADRVEVLGLRADDLRGAAGVFALVVLSTLPVVFPFIFLDDLYLAMRVSALIAITIMYLCGYGWGRYAGLRPAYTGAVMVLLGVIIEAVIILLGG